MSVPFRFVQFSSLHFTSVNAIATCYYNVPVIVVAVYTQRHCTAFARTLVSQRKFRRAITVKARIFDARN